MVSSFDLENLRPLFRDFYTLTHIHIALFNEKFEEIFPYPTQLPDFCRLIREDAEGSKQCHACDREGCRNAARNGGIYDYRCHAGLSEACTPIYSGEVIAGYIIVGNIFDYPDHETGWQQIRKLCSKYHVNETELKDAVWERPVTSKEYVYAASHILQAIASYMCNERLAILRKEDLHTRLDSYINAHLTEDLSAAALCKQFSVGKTYLYELTASTYGVGLAEHIRNLRLEHARLMLKENPLTTVGEAAAESGFKDYNYFIAAFKRRYNMTPKQYQKSSV